MQQHILQLKRCSKVKADDIKNKQLVDILNHDVYAWDVYILAGGQMFKIMVSSLSLMNNGLII